MNDWNVDWAILGATLLVSMLAGVLANQGASPFRSWACVWAFASSDSCRAR